MWKRLWSNEALKMGMSTLVVRGRPPCWPQGRLVGTPESYFFSSSSSDDRNRNNRSKPEFAAEGHNMSFSEVKKLTRLVNVEALKKKLEMEQAEVINYIELLDACEEMGVVRSRDEASSLARALDEAGVVLLFRDKVYLHPDKVAEVVRRAVPLVLNGEEEDEMRREELVLLQKKKDEIDAMAHKQVRRILWGVLGLGVVQVGLFFRLTFWEFSWDVMEPITFFTTSTGILMGYAYFLFTARDPSYQDFMQRLFVARQRKLFKLRNFNARRFKELRDKCTPANHLPSQLNLVEVDDHHGR